MKRLVIVVALLLATMFIGGCQNVTKSYGGTTTIDIPAGKRLVPYTVQWAGSNMWYLTEDAPADYTPKTYEFSESSNLGAMEGKIVFQEH